MTVAKGHCERNGMERGNLNNGTQEGQIASAKTPRNDGGENVRQKKTVIASGTKCSAAISPLEHVKNRLLHCVRNDGRFKGHCERTAGERGNLYERNTKEQTVIASGMEWSAAIF